MQNTQTTIKNSGSRNENVSNEWSGQREGPVPQANDPKHARAHEDRDDEEEAERKQRSK